MSPSPNAPWAVETEPIFSPSDLQQLPRPGRRIQLGGRVVELSGNRLELADAWGRVSVILASDPAAEPTLGSWALVTGSWDGTALHATELECFPGAEPTATSEQARLGWTGRAGALRARDAVLQAIRSYFHEQGFVEVATPTLVPCPGLDAHVHSLGVVQRDDGTDYLITSPELHLKRLLVGGMPRIFEIARCFRAEELGTWHEPEFTLVEWYRAFADFHRVVVDTEELVVRAALAWRGKSSLALPGETTARSVDVTPPFERLTVRQAFSRYARVEDAVRLAAEDPARFFELLVSEVEPALAAEARPIFLTHYPLSQAALAQPCPEDPTVAERFELYVAGLELCNGFGELTSSVEQRRRFEAERRRRQKAAEPVYPLDERFLRALEEGLPPSAGVALGLDRLVALVASVSSLALTQAFSAVDR